MRTSPTTLAALGFLASGLALGACQHLVPDTAEQERRLAFAQNACGTCHAVVPYDTSRNPDAPPFPAIANQAGLTRDTLATWLRDAHNYPEEMEFTLGPREVNELVDYMLTLRSEGYRPAI